MFFQRTWNGPDSFRDSNIIPDKLKICKLVYIIMAGNFFQNCFICRWNGRNDQTAHQRCGLVSVSFYFTYWTETAGRSIKYDMEKTSVAYESYAQRLASVYEATHRPEDFISADFEFRKLIKRGNSSAEDLRTYGILHQHMMCYCIDKATDLFDTVIRMGEDVNRDVFWKTKRQKMALLSQIGKARENIDSALAVINNGSDNPEDWICLMAAYSYGGKAEKAYKWFLKAINRFPDNALLYVYGGDTCQNLRRYDEAFRYWGKALELNGKMYDARYSMGFCYEKFGEYGRAYDIWIETARNLEEDGYDVEKQFPLELAEKCRELLEKDPQHFSQDTVLPAE